MLRGKSGRLSALFGVLLLLPCFLMGAVADAHAFTAIVAVWTPRELVIGADSKATITRGGAAMGAPSCKIQQMDSFLFAAAGHVVGFKQSNLAFDAFGLARNASATEGGLLEKANSFAHLAAAGLEAELKARGDGDSGSGGDELEGRVLLSSLFAGVEEDAPVLVVIHFAVEGSTGQSRRVVPHMKVYGGEQTLPMGQGAHAAVFLGSQKEIRRRAGENPNWWRLNLAEGIRELIEAEADQNPQYVAAPVDLVVIDRNGARWVERKAQCPAIRPPLSQ